MADVKLALTCISASIAETLTYPIDSLKTRLQLQYAGLAPAVLRHFFYTGTRISVYEQLRALWRPPHGGPVGAESAPGRQPSPGLGAKLLMGGMAGALGQLVAVPADLIKLPGAVGAELPVQMLADSRAVATGTQAAPRYKSMVHAFSVVAAQQGILGLWKGAVPAVQRAALVNLGELATYDQAKQAVLASGLLGGEGLPSHAAASCASGLVASIVSTPADVIKTRVMGQDSERPLYRGSLDCLVKSVRQEGVMALYKGFFPTWLRLGPWQMAFWVSYEQLRSLAGLGSF